MKMKSFLSLHKCKVFRRVLDHPNHHGPVCRLPRCADLWLATISLPRNTAAQCPPWDTPAPTPSPSWRQTEINIVTRAEPLALDLDRSYICRLIAPHSARQTVSRARSIAARVLCGGRSWCTGARIPTRITFAPILALRAWRSGAAGRAQQSPVALQCRRRAHATPGHTLVGHTPPDTTRLTAYGSRSVPQTRGSITTRRRRRTARQNKRPQTYHLREVNIHICRGC